MAHSYKKVNIVKDGRCKIYNRRFRRINKILTTLGKENKLQKETDNMYNVRDYWFFVKPKYKRFYK